MINLSTKFEVSKFTHYENMKGSTKCILGWFFTDTEWGPSISNQVLSVIMFTYMQFLTQSQHIVTEFSSQMSNYTQQKILFGRGSGGQTSDLGGAWFPLHVPLRTVCAWIGVSGSCDRTFALYHRSVCPSVGWSVGLQSVLWQNGWVDPNAVGYGEWGVLDFGGDRRRERAVLGVWALFWGFKFPLISTGFRLWAEASASQWLVVV